ncbi:hypothetical protein [Sphingobium cloacae]|uniref:hypothetical protein n=1 Tax=Sphingobium cloacae TaxID=120107 RepID=UPI00082E5915|nr:hypothetical protein [Sphingobium cloacae]
MFLLNVSKIFGHGLLSWMLGVIRFAFSLGTVFGFLGVPIFLLKWYVLSRPSAIGEAGISLAFAFGCFVVNVAIATVQRKLREALNRSLAGPEVRGRGAEAAMSDVPPPAAYRRPANDEGAGAGWR